jgi:hypothetical protein
MFFNAPENRVLTVGSIFDDTSLSNLPQRLQGFIFRNYSRIFSIVLTGETSRTCFLWRKPRYAIIKPLSKRAGAATRKEQRMAIIIQIAQLIVSVIDLLLKKREK